MLSGGSLDAMPGGAYAVAVGRTGEAPALTAASNDPFRRSVNLAGVSTEVRMESWVAFDTIRRMGFGQVVAAHHHTLIVERGVSFATFDRNGRATRTYYLANIFEREGWSGEYAAVAIQRCAMLAAFDHQQLGPHLVNGARGSQ